MLPTDVASLCQSEKLAPGLTVWRDPGHRCSPAQTDQPFITAAALLPKVLSVCHVMQFLFCVVTHSRYLCSKNWQFLLEQMLGCNIIILLCKEIFLSIPYGNSWGRNLSECEANREVSPIQFHHFISYLLFSFSANWVFTISLKCIYKKQYSSSRDSTR